ncbi:MAG: sulfite exporter TauE/SafE family protein [Myxococcales bacterium]|nr:sulfite exporter TauE/SafE family protein [Myxococcales bacterium]
MSGIDLYLVAAAFGTAIVSGTLGMLGGILLLGLMTPIFPPAVLIPIHGIVQLTSNVSRTLMNLRDVDRRLVGSFAMGALLGGTIGSQVVVTLPETLYRIVLAVFILVLTWMPKLKGAPALPFKFGWVGFVATFLGLFIGATGPFIAPFFVREPLGKVAVVATKAACQVTVHTMKIAVFGLLGFAFGEYAALLVAMSIASVGGNYVGKLLLGKVPEGAFRWVFKVVITALAARLLWQGLTPPSPG